MKKVLSLIGMAVLGASAIGCGAEIADERNIGSSESALKLPNLENRPTTGARQVAYVREGTDNVLTFGGLDGSGGELAIAYDYFYDGNDATDAWTLKTNGALSSTRYQMQAIKMPGTSIYAVAGGRNSGSPVATVDFVDPYGSASRVTVSMTVARAEQFSLVPCGTPSGNKSWVLAIGGETGSGATDVLDVIEYDTATPANSTVYTLKNTSGTQVTLNEPRFNFQAIPLSTTKVLVPGGNDGSLRLNSTEILNLTSDCKLNSSSDVNPSMGGNLPQRRELFAGAPVSVTIGATTYEAIIATGQESTLPTKSFLFDETSETWIQDNSGTYDVVEGRVRAMLALGGANAGDFALVGGEIPGTGESAAADLWVNNAWSGSSSSSALNTSRYGGFAAYIGGTYIAGIGQNGGTAIQSVE